MTTIQKLFEKQLGQLPQLIFKKLIEKKLRKAGINPTLELVDKIINHALSNEATSFHWDDGKDTHSNITLSISEEDTKEVEKMISRLIDSMPDIIEKISTDIAKPLLKTLKHNWVEEHFLQQAELSKFRKNLEKRWGKALSMLRILLTISRELGSKIAELRPPEESHLNNVLLRLHVRACQVTSEIITLLENGFADGAMARWRTLHEISIVTTLMNEYGEPLAERYIAHRAIEAKSAKDQYMRCYDQLGYQPLSVVECQEIDQAYSNAIATYGHEFRGPYGWAAGYVAKGGRGIGLGELEAAAGRSAMASYYKLASYNVHAGPHALFFRLGLIDESALLAGASNAGLMEPGQNTAITFTTISILFVNDCTSMDTLVTMKLLMLLRDEIPNAFEKSENKLQSDHARNNKRERKTN